MPKAIFSVYDKSGLADFASYLALLGWSLLAPSGTAKALRNAGLAVTEVADYTGQPEALGGRVKIAHPAVMAGLLAADTDSDRAELEAHGWGMIDLAVINLYPFDEEVNRPGVRMEDAIEKLDIDRVTLLRAAARNHGRVTLVTDPSDYALILAELQRDATSLETRKRMAAKGLALTSKYDAIAAAYFGLHAVSNFPAPGQQPLDIRLYPIEKLRYGENPHQSATLYAYQPGTGPLGGKILQGRELSYTNLLDLDLAWRMVTHFERPTVAIIRQTSPCGVASADSAQAAFDAALETDRASAYGGVVACNRVIQADFVQAMGGVFIECLIAPGYSDEARELLTKRKRCRVVEMPDMTLEPKFELRSIGRGVLRQDVDFGDPAGSAAWRVVSERQPTEAEWASLRFAWKVCAYARSNAVVMAKAEATIAIGSGQPNRLDCVRVAAMRAGERAQGAEDGLAMASDAFFPFPDAIEEAAKSGVTAIVHPGGSVRDQDAVAAADQAGIAMVVTGIRHFKH